MTENILEQVQEKYGAVAKSGLSSRQAGVRSVAEAFGYTPEQLSSIPAEANMGLSCGNPTAFASLKPGETVVDLGCGGGLDVLLAAPRVGPSGRAIGIDMTPAMIERARVNAAKANSGRGIGNVEFHLAMIDQLPLPSASVDCVISNCVINLAPDKRAVFREIFRVLKPGGRMAVSDIALKRALPAEVGENLLAYIGCVAGAISISDYQQGLRDAGFESVEIIDTKKDLNVYTQIDGQSACCGTGPADDANRLPVTSCCGSEAPDSTADMQKQLAELFRKYNVNDYAASVQVYALKRA